MEPCSMYSVIKNRRLQLSPFSLSFRILRSIPKWRAKVSTKYSKSDLQCKYSMKAHIPLGDTITGWRSLCSPPGGRFSAMTSTVPRVVPTHKHGEGDESAFRVKVSQKCRAEMASRDSLSMLVTLELRDRLKELSFISEMI